MCTVPYYFHRVYTQLQLKNISYRIINAHTHTHEEGTSGFAAKLRGNKHELRLDDYINVDVTETDRDGENWIKLARG